MMRRLTLAVAAVAVLVVSAGSSALQARPDAKAAPAASRVTGNIVLAHWSSSAVETQLLKQVIAAFEKKYPEINVRRRALDPYPDAMLAQFAARRPPDVFYVDSNVAPDWASRACSSRSTAGSTATSSARSRSTRGCSNGFKYEGQDRTASRRTGRRWGCRRTRRCSRRRASGRRRPGRPCARRPQRLRSTGAVPGGRPICLSPGWDRLLAFVYQNNGAFLSGGKAVGELARRTTQTASSTSA